MNKFQGFGLGISQFDSIEKTVRTVVSADQNNFDYVTIPEVPGFQSSIIKAAAVATQTNRVKITMGILIPYLRHLSSIAADIISLDELSNGRMILGLGCPLWRMADYGYTLKNLKPLTTLREATYILKDLTSGQPTRMASEFYGIPKGLQMGITPKARIPIYIGAVNKKMMQLVGEICDHIEFGAFTSPGYSRWAMEQIQIGADRVNRDISEIPVYGHVLTCLDDNPEKARELVKPLVGRYFSFLEEIMFINSGITPEELAPVKKAFKEGGKPAAAKFVTDKMIDVYGAVGNTDDVIKGFKRFLGCGMTHPIVWGPMGADDSKAIARIGQEIIPELTQQ